MIQNGTGTRNPIKYAHATNWYLLPIANSSWLKRGRIKHNNKNNCRDGTVPQSSPCNCLRVVLLRLLSWPDIGTFDRQEDVSLIVNDGVHQNYISSWNQPGGFFDKEWGHRLKFNTAPNRVPIIWAVKAARGGNFVSMQAWDQYRRERIEKIPTLRNFEILHQQLCLGNRI